MLEPKQKEIKIIIGDDFTFNESITVDVDPTGNEYELIVRRPRDYYHLDYYSRGTYNYYHYGGSEYYLYGPNEEQPQHVQEDIYEVTASSVADPAPDLTFTLTFNATIPHQETRRIPIHRGSRYFVRDITGGGKKTLLTGGIKGLYS